MKKYGRLNRDTAYFLKGTEFEITNEDEGFWSGNPFYQGRIDGMLLSYDQDTVDIIYDNTFTNKIIKSPPSPYDKQDEWWEYTKYP